MSDLTGRVAIVTGGAIGLGAVYSQALASAGATVIIADIADATDVVNSISELCGPGKAFAIKTDVSDEESVEKLVAETMDKTGQIDIVVNNAAIFSVLPPAKCTEITVDLWDKIMAVNVKGSFLLAKHVAPHMIERKYGKIINIGSGTAYKGMSDLLHYVTSKGAIVSFTRALARELGAFNICVNTLSPGLVMSDSIVANEEHVNMYRAPVIGSRSIKRDSYPEDLVGGLLFLASADSDFYTGQNLVIDGGSVNT